MVSFVLSFTQEMTWMRSGTRLSQFLRMFLPTLSYLLSHFRCMLNGEPGSDSKNMVP